MAGRLTCSFAVAAANQIHLQTAWHSVHSHDRNVPTFQCHVACIWSVTGHEDKPRSSFSTQYAQVLLLTFGPLVRISQNQTVASLLQNGFHSPNYTGQEGILQVGNDHSDHFAHAGTQ